MLQLESFAFGELKCDRWDWPYMPVLRKTSPVGLGIINEILNVLKGDSLSTIRPET